MDDDEVIFMMRHRDRLADQKEQAERYCQKLTEAIRAKCKQCDLWDDLDCRMEGCPLYEVSP
jgi:hypothetical protein